MLNYWKTEVNIVLETDSKYIQLHYDILILLLIDRDANNSWSN